MLKMNYGIFFEEVVSETKPPEQNLWDGQSELEVGMVVKVKGEDFLVKLVSDDGEEVVLDMECSGLQVVNKAYIKAAKKSHKEQTFDKVLKAWVHQGLDFAYDTKDSAVHLESFFDVMYDVMEKEEEK